MKNEHAIALKKSADKYYAWNNKTFSDDKEMLKVGEQDYEDLISIAGMIDNGENSEKIAYAMRRLDTAVRDIIPDSTYLSLIHI